MVWGGSFPLVKIAALARGPVGVTHARLAIGTVVLALLTLTSLRRWRILRRRFGAFLVLAALNVAGPLTLVAVAIAQATILAVLAVGVGATAGGHLLYFWIIRTAGPLAASTVTFIVPLAGAGLSVLWLDEPVTAGLVFGLVAILMGVGGC